ncbi:MAG: hypothetical protein OXC30_01270, partial [Alphaproteobacteria bacterium]|nr:hypothetical protein [Alphaproteobacteria bacterium]
MHFILLYLLCVYTYSAALVEIRESYDLTTGGEPQWSQVRARFTDTAIKSMQDTLAQASPDYTCETLEKIQHTVHSSLLSYEAGKVGDTASTQTVLQPFIGFVNPYLQHFASSLELLNALLTDAVAEISNPKFYDENHKDPTGLEHLSQVKVLSIHIDLLETIRYICINQ